MWKCADDDGSGATHLPDWIFVQLKKRLEKTKNSPLYWFSSNFHIFYVHKILCKKLQYQKCVCMVGAKDFNEIKKWNGRTMLSLFDPYSYWDMACVLHITHELKYRPTE